MASDAWIAVAAVFFAAIIGGACTIWAATRQSRLQAEKQQRYRYQRIARRIEGFKREIAEVKRSDADSFTQYALLAKRMRTFFHDHPEQLTDQTNRDFYDTYLPDAPDPSPNYSADYEVWWMGFLRDGNSLVAWNKESK
jgi:hypothetical protein